MATTMATLWFVAFSADYIFISAGLIYLLVTRPVLGVGWVVVYAASQTTLLHMKLNKTESPIFVLFVQVVFKGEFLDVYFVRSVLVCLLFLLV